MRRDERGSGTVLMMLGVVLLVPVVVGGLAVARIVLAHAEAAAAADLAALAGAHALQSGGDACRAADSLAVRNGARVASCGVTGERVTVEARIDVHEPFGLVVTVVARGTAGPDREADDGSSNIAVSNE